MNWNVIIPVVGLLIAIAAFLFGQGILRRIRTPKDKIFCGVEVVKVPVPSSLTDEIKSIPRTYGAFWVYNIFVRNDSNKVCMNPIVNIDIHAHIIGHVVNETNEEKREIERCIETPQKGQLILKPKRLGPNSYVDLTIWGSGLVAIFEQVTVSFASDSDFILAPKYIGYLSKKEKFK